MGGTRPLLGTQPPSPDESVLALSASFVLGSCQSQGARSLGFHLFCQKINLDWLVWDQECGEQAVPQSTYAFLFF